MTNEPSELFDEIFQSCLAGSLRTCSCGRTTFNSTGGWDWEKGELEELHENAKTNPERYTDVDYAVQVYDFGIGEIVIGCPCGRAVVIEQFLITEEDRIALYIRKRHQAIIKRSQSILSTLG